MGKDAPKATFVLILGDGGKRPLHGSGCLLDDLVGAGERIIRFADTLAQPQRPANP